MVVLLLVNVIHDPRRSLPNPPPKRLLTKHPQNMKPVRINQEAPMRRRGGKVGTEVGEVREEFGVLEVALFD